MRKTLLTFVIICVLILLYWYANTSETIQKLYFHSDTLTQFINNAGAWGPLLIISLMTIAIVMSPFPSAPIAMVAGAVYGHTEGTIYVLLGSELGAILAFFIARFIGRSYLQERIPALKTHKLAGSQTTLMITIFISRLIPFISFDVISYAAGLTIISFWRFALATFTGILPASFLLAHIGSEIKTSESHEMLFALIFLALIMILPWIFQNKLHNLFDKNSRL